MGYGDVAYHEHYDLERGGRDVRQELWSAEALNDLHSELSTLCADADELREAVAWLRMDVGELTQRVEALEPDAEEEEE